MRPRNITLYISESYIRQAPLPPHFLSPHFKQVESIRAPKYTGAGSPPVDEPQAKSHRGTPQALLALSFFSNLVI
uniref:Uncharacterized protein n=1 Tax=Anguilla anguilla TaxID=7936 RepID=A0A0E9RL95_ANGAN